MKEIFGKLDASGLKCAIVISRFNELISKKLLAGAKDCLSRQGADTDAVEVYWVPGALEIPLVCRKLAASGKYQALIALGAIIQGDTPHFDIVAAESAKGVAMTSLETGVPIINGILTTNTIDQALQRAGSKSGNKGYDAAQTAIETVNLLKNIKIK
jgi:6,7-dimethyl-8-ribityllumazine synthase